MHHDVQLNHIPDQLLGLCWGLSLKDSKQQRTIAKIANDFCFPESLHVRVYMPALNVSVAMLTKN